MTGRGKKTHPHFRIGNSKLFFADTYVEKESARQIARRYFNSPLYSEEGVDFFTVYKEDKKLIIINSKKEIVFPEVRNIGGQRK